MQVHQITPEDTKRLLESKQWTYLDVRTVPEFYQGHVPGSINIPVAEISPASGRMEFNPNFLVAVQSRFPVDAKLILGCKSGGRSMSACEVLMSAGYTNVRNIDGGFGGVTDGSGQMIQEGWSTLGYPIERGTGVELTSDHSARCPHRMAPGIK